MEQKTELQKNAIAEARKKELETYQRALDIQWLNGRMEDGRMGRCLALIQKEAGMEKDFQERTDHAAIVNAKAEKETALGIEVAKITREGACELLRRHYLRERDPTLRELMKKLQAGYVRRDLQQQILHNEYKRLQDKSEEKHANRVLLNALYNDKEEKEREDKRKMEKTGEYRLQLQQQLVSRQVTRQCQYEETLVEKKMLEDIMRTIADEDQLELQKKREQTEKMQREMVAFKQARAAWREKQKQLVIIEERNIEKQMQAASDRSSAIIADRERKLQIREEINEKIASNILADSAARQEREETIKLLQEQEHLEKAFQDDLAARKKVELGKAAAQDYHAEQLAQRQRREQQQRGAEASFRRTMEEKVAADNLIEQGKNLKKKENAKKYAQELLQQIQDNERRRRKDQTLEDNRVNDVWQRHRLWDAEVKEERNKIIEEHAPQVLGYLQAGVIEADDLEALGNGVKHAEMTHVDVDFLTKSNRAKRFAKCNSQCRILREF